MAIECCVPLQWPSTTHRMRSWTIPAAPPPSRQYRGSRPALLPIMATPQSDDMLRASASARLPTCDQRIAHHPHTTK